MLPGRMFASTHGSCSTGTQGEDGDMGVGAILHSWEPGGSEEGRDSRPEPPHLRALNPCTLSMEHTMPKETPVVGCSQAKGDIPGTSTFWVGTRGINKPAVSSRAY